MARYGAFGFDPYFNAGRPGAATVPAVQEAFPPPPQAMPPGFIQPSPPAGWPGFMIRPEVMGSIPIRGKVPALATDKMRQSFIVDKTRAAVPSMPVGPRGAAPLPPSGKVPPIFQTKLSSRVVAADVASQVARDAAYNAQELRRRAAAAAHRATVAQNRASMRPSLENQGAAAQANAEASQAMTLANRAQQNANARANQASSADVKAQNAVDQINEKIAQEQESDQRKVQIADERFAYDFMQDQPFPEVPIQPMSSPSPRSPVVYAGAGAGVGFLLFGPLGALAGAAAGYFFGARARAPVVAPVATPFEVPHGGLVAPCPPGMVPWVEYATGKPTCMDARTAEAIESGQLVQ